MSNSISFNGSINFTKADFLAEDYYIHSISLFLQNAYGIKDRLLAYAAVLRSINTASQITFDLLNVFYDSDTADYFDHNAKAIGYTSANEFRTSTDICYLDDIAAIFNIKRQMQIHWFDIDGTEHNAQITMTNEEMLSFIQCNIIKLNFDGTRNDINRFYYGTDALAFRNTIDYIQSNYKAGSTVTEIDGVSVSDIVDPNYQPSIFEKFKIHYINGHGSGKADTGKSLTCDIIVYNPSQLTTNLRNLFQAGYLTIHSMGIQYNLIAADIIKYGVMTNPGIYSNSTISIGTGITVSTDTTDNNKLVCTLVDPIIYSTVSTIQEYAYTDPATKVKSTTQFIFNADGITVNTGVIAADETATAFTGDTHHVEIADIALVSGTEKMFGFAGRNVTKTSATANSGYFGRFYSSGSSDITTFVPEDYN